MNTRPMPRVEPGIDPTVSCARCAAVCCRLTVVLVADDCVPAHYIDIERDGPASMARAPDGWCAALDRSSMRCGIYESRPLACRRFAMGGAYCRAERAAFTQEVPNRG